VRYVLVAVLTLAAAERAAACSCITSQPKTAFKQADAVFLGEVTSEADGVAAMRVLEWFKGPRTDTIEVNAMPGSTCAYGMLSPGSRHLVYAFGPAMEISVCSRSIPVERAQCDLRFLRSRASWWRSPLSSVRVLQKLGIHRTACPSGG
jgi:hypothetical protein